MSAPTGPMLPCQPDLATPLRIVVGDTVRPLPLGTVVSLRLLDREPRGAVLYRGAVALIRKPTAGQYGTRGGGGDSHVHRRNRKHGGGR